MMLALLSLVSGLALAQDVPVSTDAWAEAVQAAPAELAGDFAFLVQHLPQRDREALKPQQLLEEVRLAQLARAAVPWGQDLPEELWRNDVLPLGHVSEERTSMRADLQERFLERAKACKTPGEAALMLNSSLFGELGVRYSTARDRPDQSSRHTVRTGLASCTGLSILLADACRAVAVPARLAGIASWVNKNGNHTWVEVWDGESWRFLGAAEPDAKGLDHTWFQGDAALAQPGSKKHGIWAVSYAPTGKAFPLVWQPDQEAIHAVEVTERYVAQQDDDRQLVLVKVLDQQGNRVAAPIVMHAVDDPSLRYEGTSRGEGADTNDIASFRVEPEHRWVVQAGDPPVTLQTGPWPSQRQEVVLRLGQKDEALQSLLVSQPAAARAELWKAFARRPENLALRADLDGNLVRTADRTSPFVVREVGEQPKGGWPLVIAMHGGGGAPAAVNDSQWEHMQIYYRDHPEVSGYRYLALRAPNNEWNGFYDDSIAELIRKLVLAQVLFEGVDPNAVHLIGYSHGGYGAFVIGPKLPDLFASVHSSAAAPTDGETRMANFANLPFSCMVGEADTAYGRVSRCQAFAKTMAELAETYAIGESAAAGLYPALTEVIQGKGHGGLPDRDLLTRQLLKRRSPLPKHIVWEPSGADVGEQFWVSVEQPGDGQRVEARIQGQRIEVTSRAVDSLSIWLDERLVDLSKPLSLEFNGEKREVSATPSLEHARQSLQRWGDPERIFSVRIDLGQ